MIWRFVLEAAAITLVFTRGTIFKRLRESGPDLWRAFAGCPLCVGVWVGAGWFAFRAGAELADTPVAIAAADILASGAMTGVVAFGVSSLLTLVDRWS